MSRRHRPLTDAQHGLLERLGADWGPLPPSYGFTNQTLVNLEARGLVETRFQLIDAASGGGEIQARRLVEDPTQ